MGKDNGYFVPNSRRERTESVPPRDHLVQGNVPSAGGFKSGNRTMRGHPAPEPQGEVSDGSRRGGGWLDPALDD